MLSNTNSLANEMALTASASFSEIQSIPITVHSSGILGKILLIVDDCEDASHEYDRARFHISHATLVSAADAVQCREPDAILVAAEMRHIEQQHFMKIRALANERGLPLILYSGKFDEKYKALAAQLFFDDYYVGNITEAFKKRIDFFKRLKSYKLQRVGRPAYGERQDDTSIVKMWSMKRLFDIVVSLLLLLLSSPLLLIIGVLIKFETKGSVLYISKRAGTGYAVFNFYKFRTMRQGADAELKKLSHLNQYSDQSQSVFFKLKGDPRITLLGSFLRRTSLDELPQLINVVLGDMSLVGNRPLPLYEAEQLTRDQIAWRFLAPAGITGLWQVTKRGKENMSEEERIHLDIQYAMNSSFLFDLKILFSTIPAMLQKEKV